MAATRGDGCIRAVTRASTHDLLCGLASPWGLLACGVAFLALGAEVVSVVTRHVGGGL